MTHTVCTIVEDRAGEQALYDADGEFVCKGVVFPADYRAVKCTAVTHRFADLEEEGYAEEPFGDLRWPDVLDTRWLESL